MESARVIVSTNKKPPLCMFEELCQRACQEMNDKALREPSYYLNKNGTKLEPETKDALDIVAKGTPFEGTIQLVSGAHFPDIVADKYYGVEVKSTKSDSWSVIGSSILESTRVEDVETIFFMFGKLCNPVEFKTRRYQDCLKSIKVTHSPRYEIDMDLPVGETIFDKMGIDYESMRKMDNPIQPVVNYYKSQLQPGESLWWTTGATDESEAAAPAKLKMWRLVSPRDRAFYRAMGLALFPEIYGNGADKFENFTMWLIIHYGIVSKSMRDIFTAGGQQEIHFGNNTERFPQIYAKLIAQKGEVLDILRDIPLSMFDDSWKTTAALDYRKRIEQWITLVVGHSTASKANVYRLLRYYFLGES